MNVENILKVRDRVADLEPSRFAMDGWSYVPEDWEMVILPQDLPHNCNTCGCIGGWTNATFGGDGVDKARKSLGLTEDEADELFFPKGYELDIYTQADAVAVLTTLAEEGKVRWPDKSTY